MKRAVVAGTCAALLVAAVGALGTWAARSRVSSTDGLGGGPASAPTATALPSDRSESTVLVAAEPTRERVPVPSLDASPTGLQMPRRSEHPWVAIGGLATPDPYPDLSGIVESVAFNPRGLELTERQYADLSELVARLATTLAEKSAAAQLQLSDAVSWKIELGMAESSVVDFGHPEIGCANVRRSTRDGREYTVKIRPGEFASLDIACEEARAEALAGESAICAFIAALQ